jgi:hypothetical protein
MLTFFKPGQFASTLRCALRLGSMTDLLLRRVSKSRAGADGPEDYDVAGPDGLVVGRIFKANTSPVGTPWMWTVSYGFHEDHTPTHGYEATLEAAVAAFAKSWRRE